MKRTWDKSAMQAILENLMEFAGSRVIDWCGSQNAAVMLKEALTTTNFIKNIKLINN